MIHRCGRNCYNCPVCTSPLGVSSIHPDPSLRGTSGPYILGCPFCQWNSLELGWQFEKPSALHAQIAKLDLNGQTTPTSATGLRESEQPQEDADGKRPDATFSSLRSFYKSQLSITSSVDPLLTPSGSYSYNSPSSLARIMSLYTGRDNHGKKDQSKTDQMRESAESSEGLCLLNPTFEQSTIDRMRTQGWTQTSSLSQQADQRHGPRFIEELRPSQPLLRTKRSKRCRTCRHILVKPEPKVQSTRFKIKLVALNYIPTIFLKPLQPAPSSTLASTNLNALPPLRASQYLLTLKNPLFDPVKITLATPTITPGRFPHKVTVLCPEFEVGADADQWDEALKSDKDRRTSKHLSLSKVEYAGGEGGKVAEAGKVWEKGRNWTTVVLEIVCADVHGEQGAVFHREREDLGEDDDVLEVPVFVRMEWEGEAQGNEMGGLGAAKGGERKEKRELAYWIVLGVGRVGRMEGEAPLLSKSP